MLSIQTEKGKASLNYEKQALAIIQKQIRRVAQERELQFIETDKTKPATIDGFICENGQIICFYEFKTRNVSTQELKNYGGWIIEIDKIENAKKISFWLQSPFFVFGLLPTENKVFSWQVTDAKGNLAIDLKELERSVPDTINKGKYKIKKMYQLPISQVKQVFFDSEIKL